MADAEPAARLDAEEHGTSFVDSKLSVREVFDAPPADIRRIFRGQSATDDYADLEMQKSMLGDWARTEGYRSALEAFKADFAGMTVADVGSGTGVLACFAAKAGAGKVLAIEPTPAADFARRVAAGNGLEGVVEVIEAYAHEVTLSDDPAATPRVIVSEWIGKALLAEMLVLSAVIHFRDRVAAIPGAPRPKMMPGIAEVVFAPIHWPEWEEREIGFWRDVHGLDMSCLAASNRRQLTSRGVHTFGCREASFLAPAQTLLRIDMDTIRLEDLSTMGRAFSFTVEPAAGGGGARRMDGFLVWFRLSYNGTVFLDAGPESERTHWMQTALLLPEQLAADPGDAVTGSLSFLWGPPHTPLNAPSIVTCTVSTAGADHDAAALPAPEGAARRAASHSWRLDRFDWYDNQLWGYGTWSSPQPSRREAVIAAAGGRTELAEKLEAEGAL